MRRRRTTSSLWPFPERWGERQKRKPWRRNILNYECDQYMWTAQSANRIRGRRIMPAICVWQPKRKGSPTVSAALLRQRLARGVWR